QVGGELRVRDRRDAPQPTVLLDGERISNHVLAIRLRNAQWVGARERREIGASDDVAARAHRPSVDLEGALVFELDDRRATDAGDERRRSVGVPPMTDADAEAGRHLE